jgi:hypothetical protein
LRSNRDDRCHAGDQRYEFPPSHVPPRRLVGRIVTPQLRLLEGPNPASLLQYEMLGDVAYGSWSCQNALTERRRVGGFCPAQVGPEAQSCPLNGAIFGKRVLGGGAYVLIAAMSGPVPRMFITRVRL